MWVPALGQCGSAQSHLDRGGVGPGDIFLFFGWFRATSPDGGRLAFHGPDMHALFGYLQGGECVAVNCRPTPAGLATHPHFRPEHAREAHNTVYVARDRLDFAPSLPGYGVFRWHELLRLTKAGETRSRWDLPPFFKGLDITYHGPKSWRDGYFQSAGRGQEFILEAGDEVLEWVLERIEAGLDRQSPEECGRSVGRCC